MEKSKAGEIERSPDSLSLPNQNAILINFFFIIIIIIIKKGRQCEAERE